MENHEMLLNSGFSCALPSLMEPYLEKATYRRNTTQTFCFFWMDFLVKKKGGSSVVSFALSEI